MTLVIGKKFKDGVALGCDGRVLRALEIDSEVCPKYHIGSNYVAGFSGNLDEITYIREVLEGVKKVSSVKNARDIFKKVQKVLDDLGKNKSKEGAWNFEITIITKDLCIYNIDAYGYVAEIDEVYQGSGGAYALSASKVVCPSDKFMFLRSCFCCAKKSNVSVGGEWNMFAFDKNGKLTHECIENNS